MGNPAIPKVVQQIIFPIVVFIGTLRVDRAARVDSADDRNLR